MFKETKLEPKEGWKINPSARLVLGILQGLKRNNGHCPCVNDSYDDLCPCSNYLEQNHCCCQLYVKVSQCNRVVHGSTYRDKSVYSSDRMQNKVSYVQQ